MEECKITNPGNGHIGGRIKNLKGRDVLFGYEF